MTEPADPSLRALATLVARVAHTLQAGDDPAARVQAAADVEQLRELAAAADRQRAPGAPALFDAVRVSEALGLFADWLHSPTGAGEARARQAMTELQVTMGPLVGAAPARDDPGEREHHRREARAALDDYFREHPIAPAKPVKP
jgi:hypothetical protein